MPNLKYEVCVCVCIYVCVCVCVCVCVPPCASEGSSAPAPRPSAAFLVESEQKCQIIYLQLLKCEYDVLF